MPITYYSAKDFIGGGADDLDFWDGADLNDDDRAIVSYNDRFYFYRLEASSGATENSPYVIAPDSNAGNKRWILQNPYQERNKNLIINGLGQVATKVTALTLVKDTYGIGGADRFYGMATGTLVTAGTLTYEAAGGASVGRTGHAFKFAGVTLTGAGIVYLRYRMEAKDAVKFAGVNASFSAQVRHDVGSAIDYTIYVNKANAADNFAAVTAISNDTAQSVESGTNTEVKYEAIAMGSCGNGVEIIVKVEAGAITTKNFWFTEIQFEPGDVATPFEYEPFPITKRKCERFAWKTFLDATAIATAEVTGQIMSGHDGAANADHSVYKDVRWPHMRAAPTAVCYDNAGTAGKVSMAAGNNIAGTVDQIGNSGGRVRGTNGAAATSRTLAFHLYLTSEL